MSDQTGAQKRNRFWQLTKEAINGKEQDYTTGSIDKAILLLSVPMILETMMESMFAIVDAFFVGRISASAVAAVGITETILTLIYSLAIGLSAGVTAMVARRIGEGNHEQASRTAAQSITLGIFLSILIGIPGWFFAKPMLQMMSDDPSLIEHGHKYARILFGFNLPILLLWMLNGAFRAAGNPAIAMRSLWIANGINIVLDPIFIFGLGPIPAMGVEGAAIATTIGRSVGVLYQFREFARGNGQLRLKWAYFVPDFALMGRLIKLSFGSTLQYIIASASWIFMIFIISKLGTSIAAGYTFAIRIVIFTILPSWGMANAAATLVGQNLGAKQPDRAEKSAMRAGQLNMYYMLVVGAIYLIIAPWIMRIFTSDPVVIAEGALALRIISAGYAFYGWSMIMTSAINGAGDTYTPTLLNFVCFWLIEMPLGWLLAMTFGFGQTGVYFAIVIAESILAVAAIWLFKRGKWRTAVV
jgi:putative MATE family efflux protein